ncbi:phage adaptor protein [Klebsiella pasteurii]|uniref:phage adaptor protein n=1 Tax=Klebsiella pasteurii TaxID=2587529 RepID=UPI0035D07D0C
MSIAVVDVLGRVNTQLRDPGFIRWTKSELLGYFNDAVRAVALKRPDATSSIIAFTCAAGVRQQLPDTVYQLIDIAGQDTGRVIVSADRVTLDTADPMWRTTTGEDTAEAWLYNPALPQYFMLYPGVAAGVGLELAVSLYPTEIVLDDLDDEDPVEMPINDIFINPVVDWCLYRAFSKDAPGQDDNLAKQHLQNYNDAMGIKNKVDKVGAQVRAVRAAGETGVAP